MKQKHSDLVLIPLIFLFVIFGCSEARNAKPAAESAIADFHRRFNDGQLGEIYQTSHSRFRDVTTENDFNELLAAVDRKLGKVRSTTNVNWNVQAFNLTTTIVMAQNTEFEKGKGTETFTFEMDGEKAVLLGYNINSNDLITH